MIYNIKTVLFKRTATSLWEEGLMINEDKVIIDGDCKVVKKLHDYKNNIGFELHNLSIGKRKPFTQK